MYRSAIVGCGTHSHQHAAVYPEIDDMSLVACCDLDTARCREYADRYGIPATYGDLQAMLDAERPEIVHIVTQPNFRLPGIRAAAEAGAKAVIAEKPLALWPQELLEIAEIGAETGCRILMNIQLRYFPQYGALREVIRSGRLGEVDFIRASTWGGALAMGPHLMSQLMMILDDARPEAVWATAEGLEGYDWSHGAPSHLQATYWFPGNRRVFWECTPRGLGNRAGAPDYWMHLDLDFFCSNGVAWTQQVGSWGYQARGEVEVFQEPTNLYEQIHAGQRDFTAAVAAWLDDDDQPHECRLETALPVMWAIFGALKSARVGHQISLEDEPTFLLQPSTEGRSIEVPAGVTDNDLKALRNQLPR